jgi:hypothetical protein
VSIVTLVCDEINIDTVIRLVEAQGYRRSTAQSLCELEDEARNIPDLAVLATENDGLSQICEMDRQGIRYWLVGVGALPGAVWTRLPRKPHAHVPSADAAGARYLAQLLDDWCEREIPRVDCFHFSFRRGVPPSADWVLDVRFLDSPYWDPALRGLKTDAPEVSRYVTNQPAAQVLLERFAEMLTELLPDFVSQRRTVVRIGVGCTGGEHRSQAMAEALVSRINMTGRATARHVMEPSIFVPSEPGYDWPNTSHAQKPESNEEYEPQKSIGDATG